MTKSSRPHPFSLLLVALTASTILCVPKSLGAQQVVYGGLYHVKNSYSGGSYLDTCGHAECTTGTRYGVVTHSQPDRDGVGTGIWKIMSATGKADGQPVRIGDVVHLRNQYSSGSYLDSCGHAQCTAGTRYRVSTHSQPDRDGVGTGKWKIISATGKPAGQPLAANEEVYLQNLYGGGSYLDSCGHAQCTTGTRYGVVTHSQPDRDGVGTGKWKFQSAGPGLVGTYELQGSNGSVTLSITAGSAGSIRATVEGFTVDSSHGMKIASMSLSGRFSLQRRASEDFYLFVLHGEGEVVSSAGTSFPATFSLTGFQSAAGNATLTTQWAAAYEFAGNAEGVHGGVAAWPKRR